MDVGSLHGEHGVARLVDLTLGNAARRHPHCSLAQRPAVARGELNLDVAGHGDRRRCSSVHIPAVTDPPWMPAALFTGRGSVRVCNSVQAMLTVVAREINMSAAQPLSRLRCCCRSQ